MVIESAKEFLFEKVLFPKMLIIDQPGVIISKAAGRYAKKIKRRRMIYIFEDVLANLHLETVKEIGKENTSKIYYKIGKDAGTRYMILANKRKISPFLLKPVLEYIFTNLRSVGFSFAENINYDNKRKSLVLKGKDNLFSRKTRDGEIFSGLVSGIFSFLVGENIEAKEIASAKNEFYCKVVANKNIKKKYIPNFKELKPRENYDKINFPEQSISDNISSLRDLIKFNKVKIDSSGKFSIYGKALIYGETGTADIITRNYIKENLDSVLKKGIVQGSYSLAKDILDNSKNVKNNFRIIKSIICTMGWGILYFKLRNKEIEASFLYAPSDNSNFLYQALALNGYLNYIFNKEFEIKDIRFNYNPHTFIVKYHQM